MNINNNISLNQINIVSNNKSGNTPEICNDSCSLLFNYNDSPTSIIKNNGNSLEITYEEPSPSNSYNPQLTFNNNKYSVTRIVIIRPSFHLFDGYNSQGEIIIYHVPIVSQTLDLKELAISIPIIRNNSKSKPNSITKASNLITNIITKAVNYANITGTNIALNDPFFNLNNIVSNNPFFFYSSNNIDWIVYNTIYGISLDDDTLSNLEKTISVVKIDEIDDSVYKLNYSSLKLYSNPNGPQLDNQIYISCNPTNIINKDGKVVINSTSSRASTSTSTSESWDINTFFNDKNIILSSIIIAAIIIVIIIPIFIYLYYNIINLLKNYIQNKNYN